MSKDVYVLKLCEQCANMVLGMVLVKVTYASEQAKCQFCSKKKPVDTYRVIVQGKGSTHE